MHPAITVYKSLPLTQRILIIPGIAFCLLLTLMLIMGELISILLLLPLALTAIISANLNRNPWQDLAVVLTIYGPLGILLVALSIISFL